MSDTDDKFPNLGRGGSRLQGSLTSFKKKGTNLKNNPLTGSTNKKRKDEVAPKKEVDVPVEKSPEKPFPAKEPVIIKEPNEEAIIVPKVIKAPDDFKSHSALFSSNQLDKLRNLVNYKKWKVNPRFTIQLAIYEAIERLFEDRVPGYEFPDDFITYAPAFSEEQWGRLESFVAEIRFKEGKYALKYAIYEAIELYLGDNPIKL